MSDKKDANRWVEMSKTSWQMGKRQTKDEKRFGGPFKGPIISFGAMVEYHPISPKDHATIHQCGKKVLPGIFLGDELVVGCIRYLSSKNKRKRSMDRKKDDEFIFPVADATAKLSGTDYEFRVPTPRRELTVRIEDFSGEIQGESGESQLAEPTDGAEARADFWPIRSLSSSQ